MSDASSVDAFLSQAEKREKLYDWLAAVHFYKTALDSVSETNSLKTGELQEKTGYAFYRAAMQAESQEEFRERMHNAVASYEKAKEFYGRLSAERKKPEMLRCDAMIAYVGYWLAVEVAEKKRLLNQCFRLTEDCLKAFKDAGDALEYGKTYNQLSSSVVFGFALEWDFQARGKLIRETVQRGEQAIAFLSALEDASELSEAFAKTAFFLGAFNYHFIEADKWDTTKVRKYWVKARELSEEKALLELLYPIFGIQSLLWTEASDEALANLTKALEYGRKTGDKFIIGCALDWLSYHTGWKSVTIDDPDEKTRVKEAVLQYAEDARQHYSPLSFTSPRADAHWIEIAAAEHHIWLSIKDASKKREHLERARKAFLDALKLADLSGYPETKQNVISRLGNVIIWLASMETSSLEKKGLLEEALKHARENSRLVELFQTVSYWNRGVAQIDYARVKSGLADLTEDSEIKKNLQQEATADLEKGIKLCTKGISLPENLGNLGAYTYLGSLQQMLGVWLSRLYKLTHNKEHLGKAAKAFAEAAESFQRINLASRVAECHWRAAQEYDVSGEYLRAAENYDHASGDYGSAAENIPQLKGFYQDHALYMQAWSEIEKARHHHLRQEYESAREHYQKAANLHQSSKQWSYLTSNYAAWAQLENAEGLSRRESSEESRKAFTEATKLFAETKETLEMKLRQIENPDERVMATNLIEASDLRREYCLGRIALEEAKILDKKGDHFASSEEYGSAAEIFQKITEASESGQDRKEFKLITTLSRAWQKMTRAEAEEAPNLYKEASQLFEEAKELSLSEKTRMLASGHSRFCKALEAGTKFADTGDQAQHTAAQQHLESAAKYYVKTGFQNASEYAKATEQLFDAYVYVGNAKKEPDPEKKARFFIMAEKMLQSSAGSFMKAEHPEKREQALKLLDRVKEERELALSLSEVLHAPTICSTTTAFSTPTSTHESAVGLERFEHADIQANLITRKKELKVGESLNIEVELVNAGKGPALVTKITEIIPEGFELAEEPEMYRFEDSYLNLKGKRLDPLKTEEVKLVLTPKVQGVFALKPKILYLDEDGKYKSHEPESVTITVKELGIKGWIKGER